MISNLNALGILGEEEEFRNISKDLLRRYAGIDHGLFDAGYLLALKGYMRPVIVEGEAEMLKDFSGYINHDVYLKEGSVAICIGNICLRVSEEKMHELLKKELNISNF
jgi:hypothetical protein